MVSTLDFGFKVRGSSPCWTANLNQMEKEWLKVGDKVIAFNSNEWFKEGDVDDNSKFYQEAEIINIRHRYKTGNGLVDLKFDNGMISNGHFIHTVKPVEK